MTREPDMTMEELRAALEDVVETLEAMYMHINNPLYDKLRAILEKTEPLEGPQP
jgi:hypothetical protein